MDMINDLKSEGYTEDQIIEIIAEVNCGYSLDATIQSLF